VCLALAASCGDNLRPRVQSDGGAGPAPDAQVPGVAWVGFAPSLEDADAGKFRKTFPLLSQRDIVTIIGLPDVAGPRIVRLDIVNSEGNVYQSIWRAFATDASAGGQVNHPNSGTPITVQQVPVKNGQARVEMTIPVAGTNLTAYALTGTYQVQVYLDGIEPVCTNSFNLRGAQ
jgi:hypothetical protein